MRNALASARGPAVTTFSFPRNTARTPEATPASSRATRWTRDRCLPARLGSVFAPFIAPVFVKGQTPTSAPLATFGPLCCPWPSSATPIRISSFGSPHMISRERPAPTEWCCACSPPSQYRSARRPQGSTCASRSANARPRCALPCASGCRPRGNRQYPRLAPSAGPPPRTRCAYP